MSKLSKDLVEYTQVPCTQEEYLSYVSGFRCAEKKYIPLIIGLQIVVVIQMVLLIVVLLNT
jgi:hypothetical protein